MVPSKWKHRGAMDSDLTPPRQAVLAPKDSFLQICHLSSCLLDQTELEVVDGTVEMETPGGNGFRSDAASSSGLGAQGFVSSDLSSLVMSFRSDRTRGGRWYRRNGNTGGQWIPI